MGIISWISWEYVEQYYDILLDGYSVVGYYLLFILDSLDNMGVLDTGHPQLQWIRKSLSLLKCICNVSLYIYVYIYICIYIYVYNLYVWLNIHIFHQLSVRARSHTMDTCWESQEGHSFSDQLPVISSQLYSKPQAQWSHVMSCIGGYMIHGQWSALCPCKKMIFCDQLHCFLMIHGQFLFGSPHKKREIEIAVYA